MNKFKNKNGITLIALIITIIILLILAIITIRILMNQGIIRHANDATSQYKIAEEKEKIALGYQNYKMDKIANPNATLTVDTATVEGSEAEGGWTITFTETGNVYELDTNGNITKTEDPAQDEIAKIRAGYNKYQSDKANNTQQRETEIAELNQQIEAKQAEIDRMNEEAKNNVNQSDLDLLTQYCIGNNDKDLIKDVLDTETMKFKNNDLIPNAEETLIYNDLTMNYSDGSYKILIYFTYNENNYVLICGYECEQIDGNDVYSYPTKKVEPDANTKQLEQEKQELIWEINGKGDVELPELVVTEANVYGNENDGWYITFEETGNKYTLNPDGTIEPEKELKLDKHEISLCVDIDNRNAETISIKAITKGGLTGTIKWTIDDNNIATLDKSSGTSTTITAIGMGTTKITASCGDYIDTCTVRVNNGFKYKETWLKVGDYIDYDATKDASGNAVNQQSYTSYSVTNASSNKNGGRTSGYTSDQTFNVNDYSQGWRVLRVKDGKLELISAGSVGWLMLGGQKGYLYSVEELDAIAEIYGNGKGAISSRCINIDDINEITGYDPMNTGNGEPYGIGTIEEYGMNITYYWTGTTQPYYVCNNGLTGNLKTYHKTSFYWYDDSGWNRSSKSTTATNSEDGREKITTLRNNYYYYYPSSLTTDKSPSGNLRGLDTNRGEYKVLFQQLVNTSSCHYWIASRYAHIDSDSYFVGFGAFRVFNEAVTGNGLFLSYGGAFDGSSSRRDYMRSIITLSPDVKITKDITHDGSTQAKACTIE